LQYLVAFNNNNYLSLYQSEQVIKQRFWLRNNLADI